MIDYKFIMQMIEATTGKRTKPMAISASDLAKYLSTVVRENKEEEDFVLILAAQRNVEAGPTDTVDVEFAVMIPLMRVSSFLTFITDEAEQNG